MIAALCFVVGCVVGRIWTLAQILTIIRQQKGVA